MGWTRLDNPKPCTGLGRDNVRVIAKGGPKGSRTIIVKIGPTAAMRGSFTKAEHRCHLLLGGGEDAGNVAVSLDDTLGKFRAKRRADGRYEIAVGSAAAAGRFNVNFPAFERPASITGNGGGPMFIAFAAPPEFLAQVAGK